MNVDVATMNLEFGIRTPAPLFAHHYRVQPLAVDFVPPIRELVKFSPLQERKSGSKARVQRNVSVNFAQWT
jgi:hypothetical protein